MSTEKKTALTLAGDLRFHPGTQCVEFRSGDGQLYTLPIASVWALGACVEAAENPERGMRLPGPDPLASGLYVSLRPAVIRDEERVRTLPNHGRETYRAISMTREVLRAGVPTRSGTIYPREVLVKMAAQFARMQVAGPVFGGLEPDRGMNLGIDLWTASHVVTEVQVDNNSLFVTITAVPSTVRGRMLEALLLLAKKTLEDKGWGTPPLALYPVGSGTLGGPNNLTVQDDYELLTFDAGLLKEPARPST